MAATETTLVLKGAVGQDRHTIRLEDEFPLPAGTQVLVTPASPEGWRRGSPEAVLEALFSQPPLGREAHEELMRAINERRGDVDWRDPLQGVCTDDEDAGGH